MSDVLAACAVGFGSGFCLGFILAAAWALRSNAVAMDDAEYTREIARVDATRAGGRGDAQQ